MKTIALALLLSAACTTGWYTDRLAEQGLERHCYTPLGTHIQRCVVRPRAMDEAERAALEGAKRQQGQVEAARRGDRR